ncbi:NAD(P)H dehydrogenase (Quinone) OS=Tsukamurella paurometabola (strain ATCC 8368 / DSM / CCUG 35730 / CIP 100753 / JCM 10117 / KCTC 9821 / NBRC 16120 / NCIMB 702349 / NCTC 13040) OX=521096 GN=Tpau_3083 PE=3 SV=1 [Tsukamurella paurometabola]|uniref:NAD(P)H dehydrogenase (Quinone) n=1 Tax=Tsukamurella paurometabola (strain ATCC 8368 / DSM 20162 / CCUG 35730 / CIP 100753 / JCM 10117 / KCTC 9821 / NBRC 16120 / NCIMB 702349 / NCTC 13040) TaxID=521096 RepID=D5UUV7_TSUPD|nr:NAD(P)H-dependent oxidoreductase [Tsukamurella paurometabola]ADG79675.1 NAD(P)H dehydrogenase (quinone) [Tsukamurella paurometabola DSM 20162]SUP36713.1 General stress protein 14 [Tsukamurella paurometabola]
MTETPDRFRTLIVTAHPDPGSVTGRAARAVADGFRDGGFAVDAHDVLAFDPRFAAADLAAYRDGAAGLPPDVRSEQRRLERYDAVAIVFPVYWWTLPGALKGWIDRVFTRGWAYDDTGAGTALSAPKRLYFFGIGATNEATYTKHGYEAGMHAQLVDGLAGYMGAADSELVLLYDGESTDAAAHAARDATARSRAAAIARRAGRTDDAA